MDTIQEVPIVESAATGMAAVAPVSILVNLSSLVLGTALSGLLSSSRDSYFPCVALNIAHVKEFEPELVLTDVASLKPAIFTRWPAAKVILFDTGLQENELISILLNYKLDGIIASDTDIQLFLKALAVVRSGQLWIDNSKLKALLGFAESTIRANNHDKISSKEQSVIMLVSQGCKNRDIAMRLGISEQTVKTHISNIFRKTNVTSRSQLVPLAMKYRFAPLD